MRNSQTIRILSYTLSLCSFLCSCRQKKSPDYKNYTLLDNGRVGFVKPARSYPDSDYFKVMKSINPNLIFVLKVDSINYPWQMITITKYFADTIIPMEIAFIEQTVKYPPSLRAWHSRLADFGVYDKNGRRYRYKVSNVDQDGIESLLKGYHMNGDSSNISNPEPKIQFKIMYYFMKNDLDSIMYELTIGTDTTLLGRSDSLLTRVAESFKFFK